MNEKVIYTIVNKEQENRIEEIRKSFSDLFDIIDNNCKSSRETSLGITKLEEAQMWLIKGISREKGE